MTEPADLGANKPTQLDEQGLSDVHADPAIRRMCFLALITIFTLTALACGFLGTASEPSSSRAVIRNHLPTLTPTSASWPAPQVGLPPQPTPTTGVTDSFPAPNPTNNNETIPGAPVMNTPSAPSLFPTQETISGPLVEATGAAQAPAWPELPTPGLATAGWAFTGVRLVPDPNQEGVVLYGDMVNNTGLAQELFALTGTFYNAQGQVSADENNTVDYWPTDLVPAGGRVPFKLNVGNIQGAANFNLQVRAEPSSQSPQQDFEFLNLHQWTEDEAYCLAGNVRNPKAALQDYLVIVAVLFDSQNNVLEFGDDFEAGPTLERGQTLDFEICTDPAAQNVARYELRAWGQ